MKNKVNVAGNDVNGKVTLELTFRSHDNEPSSIVKVVPIHSQVGNSLTFKPSSYALYQPLSKPVTISLTPDDAPNGANNHYHKIIKFAYRVDKAAPITVECITQTGRRIMRQVNGYIGQHGEDITHIASLPSGYTLEPNQITKYQFTGRPQKLILKIIGKPMTGTVQLTLDKYDGEEIVDSVPKSARVHGLVGDHYTVKALDYVPQGCKPKQRDILKGTFTPSGLSKSTAIFKYDIEDPTVKKSAQDHKAPVQSALAIMTFNDQGKQISSNVITGTVGTKIDLTSYKNLALRHDYALKPGQKKTDKIKSDLTVDKLYVEKKKSLHKVTDSQAVSYVSQAARHSSAMDSLKNDAMSLPNTSAKGTFNSQLAKDSLNVSLLNRDANAAKLIARAMTLAANTASQNNNALVYKKKIHSLHSTTARASEDASMADNILKPDQDEYLKLSGHATSASRSPATTDDVKPFSSGTSENLNYQQLMKEASNIERHTSLTPPTDIKAATKGQEQLAKFTADESESISWAANTVNSLSTKASMDCSKINSIAVNLGSSPLIQKNQKLLKRLPTINQEIMDVAKKASDKSTYCNSQTQMPLTKSEITSIVDHLVDTAHLDYQRVRQAYQYFNKINKQIGQSRKKQQLKSSGSVKIGNTTSTNLQIAYISKYTANIQQVVNNLIRDMKRMLSINAELNDTTTDNISNSAEMAAREISRIISSISTLIATNKIQKAIQSVQRISIKVNNIRNIINKISQQKCKNAMILYQRTKQDYGKIQGRLQKVQEHNKSHQNIGIQAAKDRDAFMHGAHDAHKLGKPVNKERKNDPAAYEAGYRAYSNGYYDAAGNLTYYADRYQGLSQSAYADGFSNGETYFNNTAHFNNESQIKPNIKKHEQSIKLANEQANNLDVLPQPKDSDKTPEELKMMAAVLGILLKDGVHYDHQHHLESYDDNLNDLS